MNEDLIYQILYQIQKLREEVYDLRQTVDQVHLMTLPKQEPIQINVQDYEQPSR